MVLLTMWLLWQIQSNPCLMRLLVARENSLT